MTIRHAYLRTTLALLCATLAQGSSVIAQARPEQPETVMITLHAKAGAEAELAQVIERHWDTVRRLKLVLDTPHLTLRSAEGGQGDFIEIMTWRDASIPDSAPTEIQKIWGDMNRLVEKRGDRPGLSIVQMVLVSEKP